MQTKKIEVRIEAELIDDGENLTIVFTEFKETDDLKITLGE